MSGVSSLAATFALAAAAAVSTGVGAVWSSRAVAEATDWVSHTHEVQRRLEEVLSLLKDVETGQRGFLLTGDHAFLTPYEDAQPRVRSMIDQLRELTSDNPAQQQRLPVLQRLAAAKLQVSAESVQRMLAGDRAGALKVVASGRGMRAMDAVRREVAALQGEEERLLAVRMRQVERTRARSAGSAVLTTALLLAMLTTAYLSFQRSRRRITALLSASEAARTELQFLQRAVDQAALVAVTDANGRLLRVNDAFAAASGFAAEELIGRDYRVVMPQFDQAFYSAVTRGRPWRGEVRSQGRDRRETWTDTTVVPLLDAQGRPERYIAIHHEVTDRKRAELALRESESRYRTLTEALPHMVWTATPGLVPTYFSRHWSEYTGVFSEGLDFETWLALIHPDDRTGFLDAVQGPIARGETHEAEFRLRRHDGAWRRVASRAAPRRGDDGAIVQWVGTITDIHDRWQAEQALRETQGLVQAIVDGSTALVFAKDLDGRYFLTNRAWQSVVGIAGQEVLGLTDEQLFSPEVARHLNDFDRRVARTGEPVLVEEEVPVHGRLATFLSSKFPLLDAQGKVYAVGGVSTDITELKLARAEVQRLNEDLERRVEERTRQLSEANRELEAFSYTVSHDLRAPLRALQGFAQAVQEDQAERLDAEGRDHLRRIVAAARRMEQLIQDLLEYGRLSRQELPLRDVSLQGALEDALAQLAADLQRRCAAVETAGPLPPVRAHPTVLVQVLSNLVGNAAKFVAPGQRPQVRIWAERSGDRVRTFVQDNAIGIRPEHQERIFGVFERLHGQEAYPGTGVGLAIVRKGCERMGGSCGVESGTGSGSTFWFELQAAGATR